MRKDVITAVWLAAACAFLGIACARTAFAQQAQAPKPAQTTKAKVITNDNLCSQLAGNSDKPAHGTQSINSDSDGFLARIAGRWRLDGFHRGNAYWWPGHELSRPKTETDYLIGPKSVMVESIPEFRPPFITERYKFGEVSRVSDNLVDVQFAKMSDTCAVGDAQTARFKLSANGRTLEITRDPGDPEPTVETLTLIDANWSAPAAKDKTPQ